MNRSRIAHRIAERIAPPLRSARALPGARRLNDWAQARFAPYFEGEDGWAWVEGFEGRYRLRVHRAHHIGGTIYWHGAHSLNELALVRRRMGPGKVFVDGGAHLGHFSIVAAARGARVLAVEPVEAVRRQLETNLGANALDDVIVSPYALHEEATTLPLFVDPRHPDDPVATSFPAYGRTERLVDVQTQTLDRLVEQHGLHRVDMVKLDLEGAELFALKGAARLIERDRPELILELSGLLFEKAGYTADDLLDFLDERGYRVGLITDYPLDMTLRRPGFPRYGRILECPRTQLPLHGNIYAAPLEVFGLVLGG